MSDILERLAHCIAGTVTPEDRDAITLEACAEIARLRLAIRRLADQDATLSVVGGNVVVEMDATPEILEQFSQRGGQLVPFDPPTPALADAARDVKRFLAMVQAQAAVLRGLLERLGGER